MQKKSGKKKPYKKKSKQKDNILIIILVILIILSFFVYAATTTIKHAENRIFITINGYTMTLEEAKTGNYLHSTGPSPTSDGTLPSDITGASHLAKDIYIAVSDTEQGSMQQLIDNGIDLCTSGDFSYSGVIFFGHTGDQVEFNGGTLQNAINTGYFCCVPDCSCASNICPDDTCENGCGGECTGTKTCGTKYTGDAFCKNGNVYQNKFTGVCSEGTCLTNEMLIQNCPCGCTNGICDSCCTYGGNGMWKWIIPPKYYHHSANAITAAKAADDCNQLRDCPPGNLPSLVGSSCSSTGQACFKDWGATESVFKCVTSNPNHCGNGICEPEWGEQEPAIYCADDCGPIFSHPLP